MTKLGVVSVCENFRPTWGGMHTGVCNFYDALVPTAHTTIISFSNASYRKEPKDPSRCLIEVPTVDLGRGCVYPVFGRGELRSAARAVARADLVIIHGLYRNLHVWASNEAAKHAIPHVVVPHGSLDPYVFTYRGWRKRAWLRAFGHRVIGRSASILFSAERERHKASAYHFGAQSAVMPWGIRPAACVRRADSAAAYRRLLSLPDDARILLFLGRLDPMKRTIETIETFCQLGRPGWHLVIAGPDGPKLRAADAQRVLPSTQRNVHFVGSVFGRQKQDLFAAADVHILLSHRENFGYTLGEALSCGTPVVVSRGLDVADTIEQQNCGWVIAATTESQRRDGLAAALDASDAERAARGQNGRLLIEGPWSHESFQQNLQAFVQRLLALRGSTHLAGGI